MKQGDKNSLPNGWEMKTLGEVCDFKSGNTINSKLEKSEGEIIYAKVGDMNLEGNEEYITISSRYVDKNEIKENQIIVAGSIIFPKRGGAIATNKKRRILKPTIIDLNTMALVPTKIINQDYLYYWFLQIDLSKLSNGTSIPQINNYSFDEVYISYPLSFEEQQSIVAKLDEAFEAIEKAKANAEQNLKNAKELFDSYLHSIFENKGKDWEEKTLGDITSKIGSGATPRGGNASYKTCGISLIRSMNVHDLEFKEKNLAFIDDKQARELNNVTIEENDILFNITGASVARCCVVPKQYLPARVNQHVSIIRTKKEIIEPIFLNLLLVSKIYKDQLLFTGEQGATRQAITKAQLENFIVSFPKSLDEQQSIVQKLDALSSETKKLEANYQKKLEDLEELKKSILQKAFSGQL